MALDDALIGGLFRRAAPDDVDVVDPKLISDRLMRKALAPVESGGGGLKDVAPEQVPLPRPRPDSAPTFGADDEVIDPATEQHSNPESNPKLRFGKDDEVVTEKIPLPQPRPDVGPNPNTSMEFQPYDDGVVKEPIKTQPSVLERAGGIAQTALDIPTLGAAPLARSIGENIVTGAQKIKAGYDKAPTAEKAKPPTADTENQLAAGWNSGVLGQYPKLTGATAEGLGHIMGSDDLVRIGKGLSEKGDAESKKHAARVAGIENIRTDSVGNFLEDLASLGGYQAAQGAASSLPSMIPAAIAGYTSKNPRLAAIIASAPGSFIQNYGDVYSSSKEDKDIAARIAKGELTERGLASMSVVPGLAMAALDVFSVDNLIGKKIAEPAKKDLVRRVVKGVAEGAITEGGTEGLQEVISQWAQDYFGSQTDAYQKFMQVVNNVVGGVAMGGPGGGTGSALPNRHQAPASAPAQPGQTPSNPAANATANAPANAPGLPPPPAPAAPAVPEPAPEGSAPVPRETLNAEPPVESAAEAVPPAAPTETPQTPSPAKPRSPSQVQRATGLPYGEAAKIAEAEGWRYPDYNYPDGAEPAAETPAEPAEAPLLRAYGYTDEQIGKMTPRQLAAEAEDARAAGVEPEAAPIASESKAEPEQQDAGSGPTKSPADDGLEDVFDQAVKDQFGQDDQVVGTRGAPVNLETAADVEHAAAIVDQEHSPAQGAANNVQRGHAKWQGLDITLEAPAGGVRRGVGASGEGWEQKFTHAYGYFKAFTGADGDKVDVFIGPNPKAPDVYVVNELDKDTGKFRQTKSLVGFGSEQEARAAYLGAQGKTEQMIGGVAAMPVDEFKDWLRTGNHKKPAPMPKVAKPKAAPKPAQPVSVVQYLADRGGLKPDADLRALGLTSKNRVVIPGKGFRSVLRGAGMTMDQAREALIEGGYLPAEREGAPSDAGAHNRIREMIDEELRGRRSFAQGEELTDENARAQRDLEAANEQVADHIEDVSNHLEEAGMTDLLDAEGVRRAAQIMAREGVSVDQAVDMAMIASLGDGYATDDEVDRIYGEGTADEVHAATAPENVAAPSEEGDQRRDGERDADGAAAEGGRLPETGEGELRFGDQDEIVGPDHSGDEHPAEAAGSDRADHQPAEVGETVTEPAIRDRETGHIWRGPFHADLIAKAQRELDDYTNIERFDDGFVTSSGRFVDRREAARIAAESGQTAEYDGELHSGDLRGELPEPTESKLRSEQTPAGEQTVLPGAEHIGQGEQAQRKADEKLKPKVAQKPADVGLFGDESKQTDLLDMTSKSPPANTQSPSETSGEQDEVVDLKVNDLPDGFKITPRTRKVKGGGTETRYALYKDGKEAGVFDTEAEAIAAAKPATESDGLGDVFDHAVDQQFAPKTAPASTRTAAAAGKSAVKNTGMGLADVAKGLDALFSPKGKLGSGPTFDAETYEKAKPFFKAGVAHFVEAGRDVADMVRELVRYLAQTAKMDRAALDAMKPYVLQFVRDVRDGKETIDAPSSSGDLEQDRGNADPGDGLGEAGVPAAAGGPGQGARSGGGQTVGEGRTSRGDRLPQSYAPVVGESGNLELPAREPESEARAPDGGGRERSGDAGSEGLPPDRVGKSEAARSVDRAADLKARQDAQRAAEKIKVKPTDIENIRATLPLLFPEQQDDVLKAEQRYEKPDGRGMLFTNGTGTGKTFTGLGIIKRFAKQGKDNILVVAPSQGILLDWQRSAKAVGLDVNILDSIQGNGRRGITLTTYANLGANETLADRAWDLVVADEAHKLSSDQQGSPTDALRTFRALTLHPNGLTTRAQQVFRKEYQRYAALADAKSSSTQQQRDEAWAAFMAKAEPAIEGWKNQARPKALMLSATPFSYHFSLDYAEGYLFNFGEEPTSRGYNTPGARDSFYVQNLGYRMRTGRLTAPEAEVNQEVMERELHEKLKREGSLSGRALTVDKDYDRKFVLVDDAVGNKIDQALDFLLNEEDGKFRDLWDLINKKFDYLARMRLLEAIKAKQAVPYIKEQLALGRKLVVFHDYNEGGGFNPFHMEFNQRAIAGDDETSRQLKKVADLYSEFVKRNPWVLDLKFSDYRAPISELKAAFPQALIYNGTVSKKGRDEAKAKFNDDNADHDIVIVQSAAGEFGISLHDVSGKKQRVLLNLGMPIRPTSAIQQEGRIYRVGQASDAIFRYMNTGTNWERWTFAGKIADRAGTAENLGLGNQARAIRQSFIDAFENTDANRPSAGEGTGGKEADRANRDNLSEFDRAKTHYWAQQKKTGRRDQREGLDYFPTPEPLGLKMVEWANIKEGDKALEPSAGHGAIARYFPETTSRTLVEPSNELASRAALNAPGARVVVDRFENLHLTNKYNAIVMNPPFGSGGRTAIDHIEKAVKHLANGGRIVALIPTGPAADAKFDKFMDSDEAKGIYLAANIKLPTVTFERAGTKVAARVVVLDKQTDAEVAQRIQQSDRDYTDAEKIKDFFDRIENAEIKPRLEPKTKEVIADAPKPAAPVAQAAKGAAFTTAEPTHGKTGEKLFVASLADRVDRTMYDAVNAIAKKHGGYYSAYRGAGAVPGFQFKSEEARKAFLAEAGGKTGDNQTVASTAASVARPKADGLIKDINRLVGQVELTPAGKQRTADLQSMLTNLVHRMTGTHVQVRFEHSAEIDVEPDKGWGDYGSGAVGLYSVLSGESVITLALGSSDPRSTAFHEAYHEIEKRLMRPAEQDVVFAETNRLRPTVMRHLGATPAEVRSMAGYEIRAVAFEAYVHDREQGGNGLGMPTGVRLAFERIRQFLRRVRNGLLGMGFQTTEDIFERAYQGEFAGRTPAAIEPTTAQARSPRALRPRTGNLPVPQVQKLPETVRAAMNDPRLSGRERLSAAFDALALTPSRAMWDKLIDLARLQRASEMLKGAPTPERLDTHLAAQIYPGRVGERMHDAKEQLFEPIWDEMKKRDITREELHEYLYARHAFERNEQIRTIDPNNDSGSGMTDDEAQQILDAIDKQGARADFEAVAELVDAVVAHNRDLMEREGLEHASTLMKWAQAYDHYVPLKGSETSEDEYGTPSLGAGYDTRRPESRRAFGRFDRAQDILTNLIDQTQRTVVRAEKNRVAKSFLRFAQGNPSPLYKIGLAETKREINPQTGLLETVWVTKSADRASVFAAKVAGETYYIDIKHEGLLTALKNIGVERLNPFWRMLMKLTRAYSALQTAKNPEFVLTNVMRDLQDAGFYLNAEEQRGFTRAFVKNIASGRSLMAAVLGEVGKTNNRFGRLYDEWRLAGGKISAFGYKDIEEITREIDREMSRRTEGMVRKVASQPWRLVSPAQGHVVKLFEALSDVTESVTRLAVYAAARDVGMTQARAAHAARVMTVDFSAKGKYGPLLQALYAFSNPAIQGTIGLLRRLRRSRRMKIAAGGVAGLGFMLTMWNLWAAPPDDDDDKKNRYETMKYWDRQGNIILFIPGRKQPLTLNLLGGKIPLGYALAPFWMMGENAAMVMRGKVKPLDALWNWAGTAAKSFNPLGADGSPAEIGFWASTISPTIVDPIYELSRNRNWLGRPIHPDEKPWNRGKPHSEQDRITTNPVAESAAQWLNRISGGNHFQKGWIDQYPDDLEYVWNYMLGGYGKFMSNSFGMARDMIDGVDTPVEKMPFVRRFVLPGDADQEKRSDYYDKHNESSERTQAIRDARTAQKTGKNVEDAEKTIDELGPKVGFYVGPRGGTRSTAEDQFTKADKRLKVLRQEEGELRRDPNISRADRADRIRANRKEQIEIMRGPRQTYRELQAQ